MRDQYDKEIDSGKGFLGTSSERKKVVGIPDLMILAFMNRGLVLISALVIAW